MNLELDLEKTGWKILYGILYFIIAVIAVLIFTVCFNGSFSAMSTNKRKLTFWQGLALLLVLGLLVVYLIICAAFARNIVLAPSTAAAMPMLKPTEIVG